jgi:hypothetical protein
MIWDQGFFYEMGLRCIERDGLGHVRVLARNVMNMTATTIPWPQVNDEDGQRGVVRVSNLAYSLLLPPVVVYSVFIIVRRRAPGRASGEDGDAAPAGLRVGGGDLVLRRSSRAQHVRRLWPGPARRKHSRAFRPGRPGEEAR